MKKSDFLLIGIVLVIVLLSLFSSKGNEEMEEVNYPLTLVGEKGLHEITYNEYQEKVDNGDPFIVVIESANCGYCTMYMPILEEVAEEENIPIYYIDIAALTDEDLNKLSTENKYLKKNQWGTPTTLFMLGDRVLDALGQYTEKDGVISFLEGKVVMGE